MAFAVALLFAAFTYQALALRSLRKRLRAYEMGATAAAIARAREAGRTLEQQIEHEMTAAFGGCDCPPGTH